MIALRWKLMFTAVALLFATSSVPAQDLNWAAKMFEKQTHDFGVVATASDTRYRLKLKNIYQEDVHIQSVETSCGCTAATPSTKLLRSGEEGYIEIKMDTVKFKHRKDSAITVRFDSPTFAEVKIPITAYIRTDVVIEPGAAKFGTVRQGESAEKTLKVEYAGRPDWEIREIRSPREYIEAKAVEVKREGGFATYDVKVTLKEGAPAGRLREELLMITDDANSPKVPLLLEARVQSEFTFAPEIIALGKVTAGTSKNLQPLVISKASGTFKVTGVKCESGYEGLDVTLPPAANKVQIVRMKLKAPANPGNVEDHLLVSIEGREEPLRVRMYGAIVQ
jgi:hypothetical protein